NRDAEVLSKLRSCAARRQAGHKVARCEVIDKSERPELLGDELRLVARILVPEVDVEVQADPFKELLGQGDEANFDGDFLILQPAKRLQKFGNLLLDIGRLIDNQSHAKRIIVDGSMAADTGPALWGDCAGNQLDQLALKRDLRILYRHGGAGGRS